MEAKEREDLLAYLKNAISVECDVLKQNSIIENFTETSLSRKPVLVEKEKPNKPQLLSANMDENGRTKGIWIIIAAIATIVLGIWMFTIEPIGSYNYSSRKYEVNSIAQGLLIIAGLSTLAFGAWLIKLGYKDYLSPYKSGKTQYDQLQAQYDRQMNEYTTSCAKIDQYNAQKKAEYSRDLAAWQHSYHDTLAYMNEALNKTKRILAGLYKIDFIYEKYHNLPAMTSIYEYLLTGRCDELSGPHGAYNLYEDEVRKDTVIAQLNTVIANLEQIKQNQYMLYQQVKTVQSELMQINNEVRQVKGYTVNIAQFTALNAYYSELTARNTGISAAYHIMNG